MNNEEGGIVVWCSGSVFALWGLRNGDRGCIIVLKEEMKNNNIGDCFLDYEGGQYELQEMDFSVFSTGAYFCGKQYAGF